MATAVMTLWETAPVAELKRRIRELMDETKSDDAFRDAIIQEFGYSGKRSTILIDGERSSNGFPTTMSVILSHEPEPIIVSK
ncbi:MAG: cytochrome c-type biogenesis protein CcmH [Candidatus Andersenbacteria bacterium]|nr:cytochrome c-type biogenesis protein CcmH [Candidatus Andersenbacteria bacterium]